MSSTNDTTAATNTSETQRHEEYQYLDLIREILEKGEHRPDRTGTGTLSLFAPAQLKFSLKDWTFPLLTTKNTHLNSIVHELLWFISGSTHTAPLQAKGVKIWDGNGSREFLDRVGLSHHEEGDLGPVYGFQWRHFGAEYKGHKHDYTGEGVDQLKEVIHKIKHSPYDRRIILSAWNPADLNKMALPPCHMFAQFYVNFPNAPKGAAALEAEGVDLKETGNPEKRGKGVLSCQLYQRSCDMGLGVPFNIASYALLTMMIAHVTGTEPGTFTHVMGDSHVYLDHLKPLETQLAREPREFPKLRFKRQIDDIDDITAEDIEVIGYNPHKGIKMKMSV
ncbi:thymidylate synthase [Ascobolus immersus RN42]|uniref:thymidylate synthase n=1 Tax=Ascobolus immersus RN42 TaxID=1160509 RepID=A0A3N4I9N1_ASCIM|nr:thymidylate synthase [Ascobolus immersus RN42]